MSKHVQLTERTGMAVYFCDPHSPWQRGLNENTNGLLRQYLPKGADLSAYTQKQLDEIAWSLNTRPRKSLGFRTSVAVYNELLLNIELAKSATKHSLLWLVLESARLYGHCLWNPMQTIVASAVRHLILNSSCSRTLPQETGPRSRDLRDRVFRLFGVQPCRVIYSDCENFFYQVNVNCRDFMMDAPSLFSGNNTTCPFGI